MGAPHRHGDQSEPRGRCATTQNDIARRRERPRTEVRDDAVVAGALRRATAVVVAVRVVEADRGKEQRERPERRKNDEPDGADPCHTRIVTSTSRIVFCQDQSVERVLGIGGHFMRAADPAVLGAWYRECLGLDADENGLWTQEAGPTVFATFDSDTDYLGSRAQQTMLNFRVSDLDAMLTQLRAKGADVAEETAEMEGVGRFGWVTDPEGNRIELWQPA
jgi:predicted enzyme related to lactoylglutathione lyase